MYEMLKATKDTRGHKAPYKVKIFTYGQLVMWERLRKKKTL